MVCSTDTQKKIKFLENNHTAISTINSRLFSMYAFGVVMQLINISKHFYKVTSEMKVHFTPFTHHAIDFLAKTYTTAHHPPSHGCPYSRQQPLAFVTAL
jgi:hypothetical protein